MLLCAIMIAASASNRTATARTTVLPSPERSPSSLCSLREIKLRPPRTAPVREALVGFCRQNVEAEHHPALVMLGDMAMRHPDAGVRDVEKNVDSLAGPHQHRVLPDKVLLGGPVACEDDEAAGTVDVERMVHRVVRVHLVHEPELDLIADSELPVDRVVGGARLSVDKAPPHVRRRCDPVDVDHVVFPLDTGGLVPRLATLVVAVPIAVAVVIPVTSSLFLTVAVSSTVAVMGIVAVVRDLCDKPRRYELHSALRAVVGGVAHDLRMHWTGVAARRRRQQIHAALRATARLRVDDGAIRAAHIHLGDERECLLGRRIEVRSQALALSHPLRVLT